MTYRLYEVRKDGAPTVIFENTVTGELIHCYIHADTINTEHKLVDWLVRRTITE